jgi:Phage protein (N4 Gp49/phage Sf6 gene 66) family
MYGEQQIEADIQAAGRTAPRITPKVIDALIEIEQYYVFPGTTTTVCALTVHNGYVVIGHSAAASPDNFDLEIGRKIAREDARDQLWALEGYLLREKLANA